MMTKRIIVIACILVIGLKIYCFSAEKRDLDYVDAFTVNPFGLLFGIFNIQYQYKIKDKESLTVGGFYWESSTGDWKWSGLAAGFTYRFNLSKKGLTGFSVGPTAGALYVSADYKTTSGTTIFFSPGGELGYQWIWDGFTLDLNTGIKYNIGNLAIGDKDFLYKGLNWSGLAVNIGWAW